METKRKPVAPFYAVAAVWLAYALLFPLYEPLHFVLIGVVSVAVFFVVSALCGYLAIFTVRLLMKKNSFRCRGRIRCFFLPVLPRIWASGWGTRWSCGTAICRSCG